LIWQLASPQWDFDQASFDRSAASFDNPDMDFPRAVRKIFRRPSSTHWRQGLWHRGRSGGMRVRSAVEQEIRELIHKHGRMTFAQFMQACLYSPRGGFYAARGDRISAHFGTSPTSHSVFGALLARQ